MPRQIFFRLSFYLSIVLLTSCASLTPQLEEKEPLSKEPVTWVNEQMQRKKITQWEVRGRLGVQSEHNGGSMDIIWKQSGDDFSMRLIAPLGSGTYLIQGDKTSAEIRYPDGNKRIIDSIDDVFASTFEIDLPASALIDWVRGIPASNLTLDNISWNERGLMKHVEQSGWRVNLSKYAGIKLAMPHAIYLSRDDNDELDVRLLLRLWLLDDDL